jgi:hypothetical protein
LLHLFPFSQFVHRVVAWYVSMQSGYWVLPSRRENGFDAAV